ncbi:hypothetical protein ES703_114679 [subsurface metagenome]
MGVKEILGYICFAGAAISFVYMYLIPMIRRYSEKPRGDERASGVEKPK